MNTETDFDPWADLEKEEPARTPRSLETREKTERRTSYKPPKVSADTRSGGTSPAPACHHGLTIK